jgi:hypothetical protein
MIQNLTAKSKEEVLPSHLNNIWLDANLYDEKPQDRQDNEATTLPPKKYSMKDVSGYTRKVKISDQDNNTLLASLFQGQRGLKKKVHMVEPLPNIQPNQILSKEEVMQYSSDEFTLDDDIHSPEADPTYYSKEEKNSKDVYRDAKIGGTQELQDQLTSTLESLKEVFSYNLPLKPAKVKPLQFEVDKTNICHLPGSRGTSMVASSLSGKTRWDMENDSGFPKP